MILLGAGLAAATALVSGWALRRWRRSKSALPPAPSLPALPRAEGPPSLVPRRPPSLPPAETEARVLMPRGLALRLGDVLVRADGVEAWLAKALVLWEDQPMGALFFAPDIGGDVAVYLTNDADARPWWLVAEVSTVALPGGDPPSTLELQGRRFSRVRRRPVALRAASVDPDTAAPRDVPAAISAEYTDGGTGRVLVLQTTETRAYVGEELAPGMYEIFSAS